MSTVEPACSWEPIKRLIEPLFKGNLGSWSLVWSSSVCSTCKDRCIISRGKLEHIDKPERRARSSVWDTKQIHAPVTDGQSASRLPEKAREDTRCVCFHGTELRLVNASPCLQSSAVSIVSLSRRLTATCAQPRAFTCWWSPLLCTWLKTLACWHGARFSGETGGGSVAAFSRQPAATWWSTGTNSSGAACALQTSPPSATRLISYITKVGGKWKNPLRLEMMRWFVRTHLSPYLSVCLAVQRLYLLLKQLRSICLFPLCGCLCYFDGNVFVFGLVTREHFHRFYPHFHLYQPQLLFLLAIALTSSCWAREKEGL